MIYLYKYTRKCRTILFYKLQGETSEYRDLKEEDLMIIMQAESQWHMAGKFAKNGIYCDSIYGTTGYDFLLTSILVVDEFSEGYPVAWCPSNRETYEFMKIFFEKGEEKVWNVSPRVVYE